MKKVLLITAMAAVLTGCIGFTENPEQRAERERIEALKDSIYKIQLERHLQWLEQAPQREAAHEKRMREFREDQDRRQKELDQEMKYIDSVIKAGIERTSRRIN